MFMLFKIWEYCQKYPDSLALIVRKEFTDLRDSTLKDFQRYFYAQVNGDKEYHFKNGSVIMFRHGAELEVLKNLNLSIFGIEQAEEFDTEETFTYLRDRLRRDNAPYRQGIVIANTNGHNWVWKLWKNNPQPEFTLHEATTFDNSDNLPKDFIDDLKRMETESPNHYKRYVLNSWEEMEDADLLIPYYLLEESIKRSLLAEGAKVLSVDVARFGDDETVFTILQKANQGWKQVYLFAFNGQDTIKTFGHILDLRRQYRTDFIVVDDIGVGGGVVDNLHASNEARVYPFKANANPTIMEEFVYKRDECYWTLKGLFERGEIQLIENEKQMTQLSGIKFKYKLNGIKTILSKDEMRKQGFKSPDYADALMMAMSVLPQAEAYSVDSVNYAHSPRIPTYMPRVYRKGSYARV